MNIFIITEANIKIGYGHLTRSIALADELSYLGYEVTFIMDENSSRSLILEEKGYGVIYDNSKNSIISHIEKSKPIFIVIDVVHDNFLKFKFLEKILKTISIMSTVHNSIDFYGEKTFLIGHNLDKWQHKEISKNSKTKIYSGRSFIPFRKEFSYFKPQKRKSKRILIAHGGSDPKKLTELCIKFLENYEEKLEVVVLIGPGFNQKRIKFIEINSSNSKHKFILIKGAKNVAEIMASASVALINGGNIRYELCITKTPFLAISYVKSQDFYTKQLTNNGAGFFLGNYKELSDKSLIEKIYELLNDKKRVKLMEDKMESLFSADSINNIINEMFKI